YGDEEDEALITRAFRPIIYQPWHPIAIDLFQKFKLFDFSHARLGRYVEDRKYLFPLPTLEDLQNYFFRACMRLVPGMGYTLSSIRSISRWMTNLMHLGYANAGKDSNGNQIYIEGAFDASIERELFEECYEGITGLTLEGKPGRMSINRSRFTRKYPQQKSKALLLKSFNSPNDTVGFRITPEGVNKAYYLAVAKPKTAEDGEYNLSKWDHNTLWSLAVHVFDRSIVNRLTELAEHDKELAGRVEQYYKELTQSQETEKKAILQDIQALTAQIAHYDRLITNAAAPLSPAQEKRYIEAQVAAERDLEKAQIALNKYSQRQIEQLIPAFYRILGEAPGEFWSLDIDRQRRMLRMLVDKIEVDNISPHLYSMQMKWKDPVAQPWDGAIILRRSALRSALTKENWTEEELALLRHMYPVADKIDLLKTFPTKSGNAIKYQATVIGVQREVSRSAPHSILHRALCYADWVNCCKVLDVDHESEEGMKVLEQLNYMARATETGSKEHGGMLVWWLLPVVEMARFEDTVSKSWRSSAAPFWLPCGVQADTARFPRVVAPWQN
ncbi:MAG TPA: hypothetical protein VFN35_33835, partial [Ktedonobacteraceae bacterium]|nr:hypothetical protein [Ktedonobacteraceae bacterium]